jgi:hypothetical protein
MELKRLTQMVVARAVERSLPQRGGGQVVQPVNIRAGDFILVPTSFFHDMWDTNETQGDLVLAYCEIISISEGSEGAQSMHFVVRGHSSLVDPKDKAANFRLTGKILAAEFIPHYVILPERMAHEGLKTRFPPNTRT